jgi:glycerol-3-phosphate dehydrogenase
VVLSKGLVPPLGSLPTAFASERVPARAVACLGGPAHAMDCLQSGASLVAASANQSFAAQLVQVLSAAGLDARRSTDVAGVEFAGIAKNAAALAAAAAAPAGPNAAGTAAGSVFSELHAYATTKLGAKHETLAGLAGTGDLVATVIADGSRNRRAGEMLSTGMSAPEIGRSLGQTAEALDTLPMLAERLHAERSRSPATSGLAGLVTGDLTPDEWLQSLTAPTRRPHAAAA